MSIELKIKAASLAAESAIIKRIERKLAKSRTNLKVYEVKTGIAIDSKKNESREFTRSKLLGYKRPEAEQWAKDLEAKRQSLHEHNVHVVRWASRTTHLTRAFIKGMPYSRVETESKNPQRNDYTKRLLRHQAAPVVAKMAKQYGGEKFSNTTPEQVESWLSA